MVNAYGNGNLPARYQDKYQNGLYDVVIVFCDTDKKSFEQYYEIKNKINEFYGKDDIADLIVMFGNPCTMQVIIQHWGDVALKSPSKHSNAKIIEELTGIEKYDAHSNPRSRMMQMINSENYFLMLKRVSEMPTNDALIGSSNFDKFMNYLSKGDYKWIDEINEKIEL